MDGVGKSPFTNPKKRAIGRKRVEENKGRKKDDPGRGKKALAVSESKKPHSRKWGHK